jgi:hypothetical protein
MTEAVVLVVVASQGYIPRGIDQSYISGFLAREIEAAATRAMQAATTTSSSSSSRVSGAVLLSNVVSQYSQLMGVDHLALAVHKLAELQQEGAAGPEQVRKLMALSPVCLCVTRELLILSSF